MWSVGLGPEVCPYFYAAMGAIRVESWRRKAVLAGGTARELSEYREVIGQAANGRWAVVSATRG